MNPGLGINSKVPQLHGASNGTYFISQDAQCLESPISPLSLPSLAGTRVTPLHKCTQWPLTLFLPHVFKAALLFQLVSAGCCSLQWGQKIGWVHWRLVTPRTPGTLFFSSVSSLTSSIDCYVFHLAKGLAQRRMANKEVA